MKVIFLPKNYFSFAFCTFISVICYFIYHHQTISSWFKKLYLGVMNHLNHSATNLKIITNKYAFRSICNKPFRRLKNNCMIQVNIPIFSVNGKPHSAFYRVKTEAMFTLEGQIYKHEYWHLVALLTRRWFGDSSASLAVEI